jgi:predicted nucleotide-binding protein
MARLNTSPSSAQTNHVFVVHGHAEEMKPAIARTFSRLGLQPIILHEQPNQGRTLIEKFERSADVQFAVILLSPDDMGYVKTASPDHAQAKPRQNVILELGYFVGKLTRARVFALKREGDLELPNDIAGLVYTPYDAVGHWHFELVRELKVRVTRLTPIA